MFPSSSGRRCQSVKIVVSGMVSVHRDDMIDISFVLYDLKFWPSDGTSFTLVVMEGNLADVPLSTFQTSPIPFRKPSGEVDQGNRISNYPRTICDFPNNL